MPEAKTKSVANDVMQGSPQWPGKHFLQSEAWAMAKSNTSWRRSTIDSGDTTYNCFRRRSVVGGVIYIPGFAPNSLKELKEATKTIKQAFGHKSNTVVKVEPCMPYSEELHQWFVKAGWVQAKNVQYTYTVQLDLTKSIEQLYEEMKSRARQEIKKAREQNVEIQEVEPTDEKLKDMLNLLQSTSKRKHFTIRDDEFIMQMWRSYADRGELRLFFAMHEGEIAAGSIILTNGDDRAWYKDGGSSIHKSKQFGPRLLFIEIASRLKEEDFKSFDLCGIPDPATYEQSHMRGIYVFKTAYTREPTKMMPAFELPLNKVRYKAWPKVELGLIKTSHMRSKMWY